MTIPGQRFEALSRKLDSLRSEILLMRASLEGREGVEAPQPARVVINFTFERRPEASLAGGKTITHELTIDGDVSTLVRLSLQKTAVLFALLLDLRLRRDRNHAIDVLETARQVLAKISPSLAERKTTPEALRAQLSRLNRNDVLRDHVGAGAKWSLRVTSRPFRFQILRKRDDEPGFREVNPEEIDIRLETTDPELRSCLEEWLPQSVLDSLRRNKVEYIAGGPDGFDQLFLDFFDHPFPVSEMSMFFKPSIVTYPLSFLEFLRASTQDKRRQELVLDGFGSERIEFLELLNLQTLDDMITMTPDGQFTIYGPGVTVQHVADHLSHMAWMVSEFFPQYRLFLSNRPLPFYFSTFQVERKNVRDCYTTFFRQMIREHDPDVECFAIFDEDVFNSIEDRVVPRVVNDPETLRDPHEVRDRILYQRSLLLDMGPRSSQSA